MSGIGRFYKKKKCEETLRYKIRPRSPVHLTLEWLGTIRCDT